MHIKPANTSLDKLLGMPRVASSYPEISLNEIYIIYVLSEHLYRYSCLAIDFWINQKYSENEVYNFRIIFLNYFNT